MMDCEGIISLVQHGLAYKCRHVPVLKSPDAAG